MNMERTQHTGHYGVVFTLVHFKVEPTDAASLRTLNLPEITSGYYEVIQLIEDTYARMLVQGRRCRMMLAISRPMSRNSADLLNDQRATIGAIVGSISGKVAAPLGAVVGAVTGATLAAASKNKLPTYHAGDVIFSVDAEVSGGIGPQRSSASLILKVIGGR